MGPARAEPIVVASRQLHLRRAARRHERGGGGKTSGRDVGADVDGDPDDDQRSADDAECSLPHGERGGEPASTSRACWYSSAVMSPLANLRARMSCGVSAITGCGGVDIRVGPAIALNAQTASTITPARISSDPDAFRSPNGKNPNGSIPS